MIIAHQIYFEEAKIYPIFIHLFKTIIIKYSCELLIDNKISAYPNRAESRSEQFTSVKFIKRLKDFQNSINEFLQVNNILMGTHSTTNFTSSDDFLYTISPLSIDTIMEFSKLLTECYEQQEMINKLINQ